MKTDLYAQTCAGRVRIHPLETSDFDCDVFWHGAPSIPERAAAIRWLEAEGFAAAAQGRIPYDQYFKLDID